MLRRILTSSWPPMLLTALLVVLLLLRTGLGELAVAKYAVYLAVAVALPGVFTWRLLLQHFHREEKPPTWFEDLSLGTILGFGLQLPFFLLGVWIGVPLLFLVLPIAVVAASFTAFGKRVWTLPTSRLNPAAAWSLAAISVYGVLWLGERVFFLRPLSLAPHQAPSVDETFHLALTADIANRFPPQIPFLLDVRLDYHWFVHAQIAAAGHATGIESVVQIRQLIPAITLVLAILGLGAVALRLTSRPVAAVIAPALLVAGAYSVMGPHFEAWNFTEPYISKRHVSSPSQSYGVMMSMPALMLLLEVLRPDRKASRMTWVALILALFALSGAKATFMPVFVCGAVAVWGLHLLFKRRIDPTYTALVVLLLLVTAFAQFVLFGGQSGAMAFDPLKTVESAVRGQGLELTSTSKTAMTATLLVCWLLYGVGAFALAVRGRWRDPRAVMLLVATAAGVTVGLVFFRTGLSQLWFQRSVAELVVLVSAWGMAFLLPDPFTKRDFWRFSGLAAAAGLAAFAISSYIESGKQVIRHPTLTSVVLTAVIPLVVFVAFLVVRVVVGGTGRPRPGFVLVVTFLLGLGLTNVFSLGYDVVTQRDTFRPQPNSLFAKGGAEAATYIEKNSAPDEIVATNVHCLKPPPKRCDNRNFWVAAYTERRIVIEGWGYTAVTNATAKPGVANRHLPVPYPERMQTNNAPFREPSAQAVNALVDEYDVSWLFVSKKYPAKVKKMAQLTGVLDKQFENPNYVVFEVDR